MITEQRKTKAPSTTALHVTLQLTQMSRRFSEVYAMACQTPHLGV
ncbi:hypothetical protein M3J09_007936 [Ascochyta lentis]